MQLQRCKFKLPVNSNVRINYLILLDEKLSELLNSDYTGGVHGVTFEGSNLSSGISSTQ